MELTVYQALQRGVVAQLETTRTRVLGVHVRVVSNCATNCRTFGAY